MSAVLAVEQIGCLRCGAPTKRFVSSGRFAKFCSDECCEKHHRRTSYTPQPRQKFIGPRKPKKRSTRVIDGTCARCGISFIKRVQHGKKKGARNDVYCGRDCSVAAALDIARRSPNPGRPPVSQEVLAARIRQRRARAELRALDLIRNRYRPRFGNCRRCDTLFFRSELHQQFCGSECEEENRRNSRRIRKALERARRRRVQCERVNPLKVFDRDSWRCQLCGVRTPKRLRGTYDARAPELDHIIPLSCGGAHSYANTQCACRKCNGEKGNRPLGQLGLGLRESGGNINVINNVRNERAPTHARIFNSGQNSSLSTVSAQKPDARGSAQ